MPQMQKISRNNTAIERDGAGNVKAVTLHNTRILEISGHPGARVVRVNDGGWATVTTATRLTQSFNEIGLPLAYSRKGGVGNVYVIGKWDTPCAFNRKLQCWELLEGVDF